MELPQLRFQILLDILKPDARPPEPQRLLSAAQAPLDAGKTTASPAAPATPLAARAPTQPARLKRQLPRLLVFAAGLLFGWILLGWGLWPVQWVNATPAQLQPQYQRAYVSMAADLYARTADTSQLETSLAGWPRDDLAGLLAAMQTETTNPVARQRLVALATALRTAVPPASQVNPLFSKPLVLVSALLALLPLLAAGLVIAVPRMRRKQPAAESPDGLGAPGPQAGDVPNVQTGESVNEAPAAQNQAQAGIAAIVEQGQPADTTQGAATNPDAAGPVPAGITAATNLDAVRAAAEAQLSSARSKKEDRGVANNDAESKPPETEKSPAQKPAKAAAEATEKAEEAEGKSASGLGDLLSLFEDTDGGTTALEALCSTLPDIDVDELLAHANKIMQGFRTVALSDTSLEEDPRR